LRVREKEVLTSPWSRGGKKGYEDNPTLNRRKSTSPLFFLVGNPSYEEEGRDSLPVLRGKKKKKKEEQRYAIYQLQY